MTKEDTTALMEDAQPIVAQEASKLRHLADTDDLEQEAYLAIIKQDDWLTPQEIRMTARWAMLAYLNRQDTATNEDFTPAEEYIDENTSEESDRYTSEEIGPDTAYNEAERAQVGEKAQLVMGEEGEVLRRHYGLYPHTRAHTLDEIRIAMHLSRTQTFRLLQEGLAQLSDLMV